MPIMKLEIKAYRLPAWGLHTYSLGIQSVDTAPSNAQKVLKSGQKANKILKKDSFASHSYHSFYVRIEMKF